MVIRELKINNYQKPPEVNDNNNDNRMNFLYYLSLDCEDKETKESRNYYEFPSFWWDRARFLHPLTAVSRPTPSTSDKDPKTLPTSHRLDHKTVTPAGCLLPPLPQGRSGSKELDYRLGLERLSLSFYPYGRDAK